MMNLKEYTALLIKSVKLLSWPVGSIYTSTKPTDPHELFGGTWEPIQDTFLWCAGPKHAAGTTGGEETHVLTEAELPALSGEAGRYVRWNGNPIASGILRQSYAGNTKFPSVNTENAVDGVVKIAFGGNQPHNNMPPYKSVYAWQRVK